MARPRLNIDPLEVRKHAKAGANNCEIADFLFCDEGTIRKRFARELRSGRAERKMILRQAQNKLAADGNATMLIWLGKNELGQVDAPVKLEHSGPDGGTIKTETTFSHESHASLYRQFAGRPIDAIGGDGRGVDSTNRN